MANKSPQRCQRTGKIKLRTELDAKIALASTHSSPSSEREEGRYYRCKHCRSFHLTSQPQRRDPL